MTRALDMMSDVGIQQSVTGAPSNLLARLMSHHPRASIQRRKAAFTSSGYSRWGQCPLSTSQYSMSDAYFGIVALTRWGVQMQSLSATTRKEGARSFQVFSGISAIKRDERV